MSKIKEKIINRLIDLDRWVDGYINATDKNIIATSFEQSTKKEMMDFAEWIAGEGLIFSAFHQSWKLAIYNEKSAHFEKYYQTSELLELYLSKP